MLLFRQNYILVLMILMIFRTETFFSTQKISEPQTEIKLATFWTPVRRSNLHWAYKTQIVIVRAESS